MVVKLLGFNGDDVERLEYTDKSLIFSFKKFTFLIIPLLQSHVHTKKEQKNISKLSVN